MKKLTNRLTAMVSRQMIANSAKSSALMMLMSASLFGLLQIAPNFFSTIFTTAAILAVSLRINALCFRGEIKILNHTLIVAIATIMLYPELIKSADIKSPHYLFFIITATTFILWSSVIQKDQSTSRKLASIITKAGLVSSLLVVYTLLGSYVYIWIPIMISFLFIGNSSWRFSAKEQSFLKEYRTLLVLAGITSGLYQIALIGAPWAYMYIAIIIIIIVAIYLTVINKRDKKLKDELLRTQNAQEQEAALQRKRQIEELLHKSAISWSEAFQLVDNLNKDIIRDKKFLKLFQELKLNDLIVISDIKKQITWASYLERGLDVTNRVIQANYDDKIIVAGLQMINELKLAVHSKEEYKGYEELQQAIKRNFHESIKLMDNVKM